MITKKIGICFLALMLLSIRCADYELLDDLNTPEPVLPYISGVSDSSVTLGWSASRDESFLHYRIYYSQSDIVDTNDTAVDTLIFRSDTVKTVYGLQPATHYFFRVMVCNQWGRISPSAIVDTITNLDNLDPLLLYIPDSDSVTSSSVVLCWSRSTNTLFRRYRICIDTLAALDTARCRIERQTVSSDTCLRVGNLAPNRTYWFKIFVENNRGEPIGRSNLESATTRREPSTVLQSIP